MLGEIYYFSAYFPWDSSAQPFRNDPSKEARHKVYRKALESKGIHTTFGYFRKKSLYGPHSKMHFDYPEEKQTDVNIAVSIIRDAALNRFDTGILVSGDTDFLPVFDAVKSIDAKKKIGVLFPFRRTNSQMHQAADFQIKTKLCHYEKCLLPDPIIIKNGQRLYCPKSWK